mmetsp:Transcript_54532/g.132385  ORF Transcript_54532/g.132385 Transcript_54532/m.132385 type:complete len:245 (-) Transcript_54532:634-1368(-)
MVSTIFDVSSFVTGSTKDLTNSSSTRDEGSSAQTYKFNNAFSSVSSDTRLLTAYDNNAGLSNTKKSNRSNNALNTILLVGESIVLTKFREFIPIPQLNKQSPSVRPGCDKYGPSYDDDEGCCVVADVVFNSSSSSVSLSLPASCCCVPMDQSPVVADNATTLPNEFPTRMKLLSLVAYCRAYVSTCSAHKSILYSTSSPPSTFPVLVGFDDLPWPNKSREWTVYPASFNAFLVSLQYVVEQPNP